MDTEAHGDCQFIALLQTAGLGLHHMALREIICNYLALLPAVFGECWEGQFADFNDYLANMRKESTWGDHLTLQAAANLMLRPIWVVGDSTHDNAAIMKINPTDTISREEWETPIYIVHYGERRFEGTEPGPNDWAMNNEPAMKKEQ